MKLIKLMILFGTLLSINLSAATISGNTHCDTNADGIQDPGETCDGHAIWIKLQNVATGKFISTVPDASGIFTFTINKIGAFKLFIDNNADGKDDTATPPANMLFIDPIDGNIDLDVTLADNTGHTFVMEPDPTCACGSGDGVLTRSPIVVDGIIDEWDMVLADPDNGGCDSATQTDYDINKTNNGVIQSTGRNLVRFNWTGQDDENGFVYGYTQRVGSSTNTETFLFYKDNDADGLMETGDIALTAAWQGNTGTVKMEICDYVPVNVNGDPMVWQQSDVGTPLLYPGGTSVPQEWVGKADGYTIQGSLTNCRTEAGLIGKGSDDGHIMEWQVSWKTVNMTPFSPITYHISTMNAAVNSSNPPGQIDDNMGSCPLPPPISVLSITKVADNTPHLVGEDVTYTVTVTNNGPNATGGVVVNDLLPPEMTHVSAIGTDWTCVNNGQDINCTYDKVLADQESSSITIVATLDDNNALWGNTLTNTACSSSDVNKTIVCVDEDIVVYTPVVNLDVTKSVSNTTPFEGEGIFYTISVTNTGDDTANNIVLNDVLPSGVSYLGSFGDDWVCTEVSNTLDCNFTRTLAKDGTTELVITVDVNGTEPNTYTNTACAHADENTSDSCDSVLISPLAIPPVPVVLTITKGVLPTTPIIGETIVYGIIVTNVGTATATNVEVNDTLPAELIYIGSTATNGSTYNGSTSWSVFDLAPGAQATLTITATVKDDGSVNIGDTVNNEACSNADENTTVICSNVDFTVRAPDVTMSVDKTVDNMSPRIKDQITYTIVVTNDGNDIANNVEVTDALPPGVTYNSHSLPGEDYDNTTTNVWLVGTMAPGDSRELNITAQIGAQQAGNDISNIASVIADEALTPVDDDANLTVATIIIDTLKIVSNNSPAEGDLITYTIVVNNTGNAPASNIIVTDVLPSGVTYSNAGGTNWTCVDNGDIECTYTGELAPGIPISFDLNVTVDPGTFGTSLINTACTVVDQFDTNLITEVCADVTIRIDDDLDLSLSKVVDNSTPSEGDTVVYTISVTNNGPLTATGVEVTEDVIFISGLTLVSTTPSHGSMLDNETWGVGTLNAGETATLQVVATVNTGAGGNTYINNAVLTGLDQTDIEPSNNQATATIIVTAIPSPPPPPPETCDCDNISSDSSPALNGTAGIVMILMTMLIGLFFVRREEQYTRNER